MKMRKENTPVYTLKADAGPTQKGLMRFQIEVYITKNVIIKFFPKFNYDFKSTFYNLKL